MLRLLTFTLLLAAVLPARGQTPPAPADSLRSYDMAEIVVSTGAAVRQQVPYTMQRISLAALAQQDAMGVSDVVRLVPAAHVQTNSRGETLVYLRNAGERQVAFFFDGALLNVPWDNRVDLSLVPATVVGALTVAKGVPSVLYGTNVLGGALQFTSRTLSAPGRLTEVGLLGGAPRAGQVSLTHLYQKGHLDVSAAASYTNRTGDPRPGEAALPFSQDDDGVRTNTDRRLTTLFGSARYRISPAARFGVSVLHLDGEKGVAPESHLDPSASRVRFWRYPTWRNTMVILHGDATPGTGTHLRGAVWGTRFDQTIDQYRSAAYETLDQREENADRVLGTRLTLAQAAGPGEFRLALNALTAAHDQRERAYDLDGRPIPFAGDPSGDDPTHSFRQHTLSSGGEYDWQAGTRLRLLAGGSIDALIMPETGDKPGRDPFVDYGVTTGATYEVGQGFLLRASAGRKVRFPTMRELFGEALQRFVVNPDLKPESSLLAEAGMSFSRARVAGEVVAFVSRTFDTIDQQSLPGGRRMRINLDGSRVVGVEVGGTARPASGVSIDGHLTWMRARGFSGETTRPLAEKPAVLGTLTVGYDPRGGLSFVVQPVVTGTAYALHDDGQFRRLPPAVVVNARAAYRYYRSTKPSFFSELFVRVDNLGDATVLPQLGLPAPGREVRMGLNVTL